MAPTRSSMIVWPAVLDLITQDGETIGLPKCLGLVIAFHDTQQTFLSPCLLPHHNIRMREVIRSQRPQGNLKHAMEYTCIDHTTALIKTSLPPQKAISPSIL